MKKKYKDVYYDVPDVKTIKELVIHGVGEGKDQPLFMYDNVNGTKDNPFITKTFNDVWHDINCLGTYMFAHGVKDCNVAIIGENSYEWIIAFFANLLGKIVSVPLDPKLPAEDLAVQLNEGECKAIFYSEYYAPTVEKIKEIGAPMDTYLYIPDFQKYIDEGEKLLADGYTEYKDVVVSPDDLATIVFTSGTTGKSKGVMLTHYNILNNGQTIGDGMKFTHDDRLCITVPFFHCFGMVLALMSCISHGTPFVPIDMFNAKKVMDALVTKNCTAVHGVPTMFIAMLEHPDFDKYDFSHMRTGIMAGSPCPIKTMYDVSEKMNMHDIVIVFGQTEAAPGCTMTTTEDSLETRCATVGKAFPGVECKIVDPNTGETLPAGEIGEFCARGYNIMKGYYKMPEATAQAIDKDGWLHFGDLAVCDENGYYKVTGRLKDMIIRGGENIYPKELEECLYHNDRVKDVQVIGVPSKKYGEEVCACVILKEGEDMTEEEIKAYYKENVAFFKIPKYVWIMDEFPMTASGKIQKFVLRDMAVEKYSLQSDDSIETA